MAQEKETVALVAVALVEYVVQVHQVLDQQILAAEAAAVALVRLVIQVVMVVKV